MFSLSLNPTKYPTEHWNNGLQSLMMHKYFSSQHSPSHNDIHEAPRSSSPFIIYLLYFTLLSPQRFLKIPRTWTHQGSTGSSTSPTSPQSQSKHSPCTEGTGSWWENGLWPTEHWKQSLQLRAQNVPRVTPLPQVRSAKGWVLLSCSAKFLPESRPDLSSLPALIVTRPDSSPSLLQPTSPAGSHQVAAATH